MTTSTSDTSASPVIRIAKIGTCPSISQASELTFHIGYEAGNPQQIYLRLVANSGPGRLHPGWLALAELEKALASIPADGAFKASVLAPLFRGRSTNNLHFSIAVLLHCGLLKKAEAPAEGYIRNVPDAFWKELTGLIASNIDLPVPAMAASPEPKRNSVKPAKKSAAPAANG